MFAWYDGKVVVWEGQKSTYYCCRDVVSSNCVELLGEWRERKKNPQTCSLFSSCVSLVCIHVQMPRLLLDWTNSTVNTKEIKLCLSFPLSDVLIFVHFFSKYSRMCFSVFCWFFLFFLLCLLGNNVVGLIEVVITKSSVLLKAQFSHLTFYVCLIVVFVKVNV